MSNKIKVNIKCWQRVQYDQEILIDKEDFEKLKEVDGMDVGTRRNADEFHILQKYIDHSEVFDAKSEYEDFDMEPAGE